MEGMNVIPNPVRFGHERGNISPAFDVCRRASSSSNFRFGPAPSSCLDCMVTLPGCWAQPSASACTRALLASAQSSADLFLAPAFPAGFRLAKPAIAPHFNGEERFHQLAYTSPARGAPNIAQSSEEQNVLVGGCCAVCPSMPQHCISSTSTCTCSHSHT